MLIKMKPGYNLAGPHGTAAPGKTINVPDEVARQMVKEGYALEVATAPPAQETATAPSNAGSGTSTGGSSGSSGADGAKLDTTPGPISTVNSAAAFKVIEAATTPEQLDALEADELKSEKHEGGRKGVLEAIAERRAELAEAAKGGDKK